MVMDRTLKQLMVGTIYLALIGAASFGVYRYFFPAPTCSDGIQNQTEEGIDCGAICGHLCAAAVQPLKVQLTHIIPVARGEYDVVVAIKNPNSVYGSGQVPYTLSIKSATGQDIQQRNGTFYILPGQTRFLVESSIIESDGMPTLQFQLGEPTWQQFDGAQPAVAFPIKRESYTIGTSKTYEGVVVNDSNYDFQTVDIAVIVTDTAGTILAVNTTNVNTLTAHEERYFKVSWPVPIPSQATTIRVEATTDVFANDNFLKTHGVHEPFQEFR